MTRFAGATIWITGASSGIGEALAEAFAGEGAALILSGRRRDALDALAARLGGESLVLPFEATDWAALAGAAERAWALARRRRHAGQQCRDQPAQPRHRHRARSL